MALTLPPLPQSPVSNNFEWREWFYALSTKFANGGSGITFRSLDFSDSNINSISVRDHNTLTNIQGGDSLNRYHLTVSEYLKVQGLATVATTGAYSDLTGTPTLGTMAAQAASSVAITGGSIAGTIIPTGGISATITTAKLTSGGANGSMTFTNGILTAQTQAT